MQRLFWPLLGTVLLEGFFLEIVWWAVAAAALAVVVFLVCEAAKVHRTTEELIARFNAENPQKSPEAEGKRILEPRAVAVRHRRTWNDRLNRGGDQRAVTARTLLAVHSRNVWANGDSDGHQHQRAFGGELFVDEQSGQGLAGERG